MRTRLNRTDLDESLPDLGNSGGFGSDPETLEGSLYKSMHSADTPLILDNLGTIDSVKLPPRTEAPFRHALVQRLRELHTTMLHIARLNAAQDPNLISEIGLIAGLVDLKQSRDLLAQQTEERELRLMRALDGIPLVIGMKFIDHFRKMQGEGTRGRPKELDSHTVTVWDYRYTEQLKGRSVGPAELSNKFCKCGKEKHRKSCHDVMRYRLEELKKTFSDLDIRVDHPRP
jgi:hypothetical protein